MPPLLSVARGFSRSVLKMSESGPSTGSGRTVWIPFVVSWIPFVVSLSNHPVYKRSSASS